MAKKGGKSIRQLKIEAKAKGVKQATEEVEKLDFALRKVSEIALSTTRTMELLGDASTMLSLGMNTVSKAMKTNKPQTKSLEKYMNRMFDVHDSLQLVESQAVQTAKALGAVDDKVNLTQVEEDTKGLTAIMKELLKVTKKNSKSFDHMSEELDTMNIQLDNMWENTDRAADGMDELNKATRRAGKGTKRTTKNIDRQNNALKRMNGTGSSTTRGMAKMLSGMNPLTSAYASIAVNVYALSEAFRVVSEAANLSRLVEQTSKFSAAVSGVDVQNLAQGMRELSEHSLSVKESLAFATKGVAFNFTTKQLEKLTVGAKKASIALGINFTDAMDRVLRGISKQEIELFDELGVVTRLTPAFQTYADSIGKTIEQLTDYERQVALTNEVQGQLDERFSGIDIAATAWEQLGAATQDTVTAGLQYIAEVLGPAAQILADLMRMVDADSAVQEEIDKTTRQVEIFNNALKFGNLGAAITSVASLTTRAEELKDALVEVEKQNAINAAQLADPNLKIGSSQEEDRGGGVLSTRAVNEIAPLLEGEQIVARRVKLEAEQVRVTALQVEQYKKLAVLFGIQPEFITAENGAAVISFGKNIVATENDLNALVTKAMLATNPFKELVDKAIELQATVEGIPQTVDRMKKAWVDFSTKANIDTSITSAIELEKAARSLGEALRDMSFTDANSALQVGAVKDADLTNINNKIKLRKGILEQIKNLGDTVSVNTRREITQQTANLELQKKNLEKKLEIAAASRELEIIDNHSSLTLQQTNGYESVKEALVIRQMIAKAVYLESQKQDTRELRKQITLAEHKLEIDTKAAEARQRATGKRNTGIRALEDNKALAGSEKDRVAIAREQLDIKEVEVNAMKEGLMKELALRELLLDKIQQTRAEQAAAHQDGANTMAALQSLDGLSDMQTTALEVGVTIENVFAQAALNGQGFADFLAGNAEAFTEFSVSIANAAGAMFQQVTAGKIDSINLEIAAEKRRDGKSKESLEVIRRLEKKKIMEKKKADIASAGMSTAVAVMRTMAEVPTPGNFIMAGIIGAMGLMQIANINKAANGQVAALGDTAGKAASVTVGGNRSNAIDVSGAASAGELSFLRGGATTGGRAGGGFASAGSSYTTGERGPEVVTPIVPSMVTPAGEVGKENGGNSFNVNLNVSTMDSESFASTAQANAAAFWDAVETEANSRGVSLENL